MANEITVTVSLRCDNGSYLSILREVTGAQFTQATLGCASGVQAIGTAAEAIVLTDITTPGWAYFRNLGPTNYVEIGDLDGSTFTAAVNLKVGEAAVFPVGTTAARLAAKANSAGIKLEFIVLER